MIQSTTRDNGQPRRKKVSEFLMSHDTEHDSRARSWAEAASPSRVARLCRTRLAGQELKMKGQGRNYLASRDIEHDSRGSWKINSASRSHESREIGYDLRPSNQMVGSVFGRLHHHLTTCFFRLFCFLFF